MSTKDSWDAALSAQPSSEQLREEAFALLSQIEQRLNDFPPSTGDSAVAAAILECKQVIMEVEAGLARLP